MVEPQPLRKTTAVPKAHRPVLVRGGETESIVRHQAEIAHRHDPAAGIAPGVIERIELLAIGALDARLLLENATRGAVECLAIVDEPAGQRPSKVERALASFGSEAPRGGLRRR